MSDLSAAALNALLTTQRLGRPAVFHERIGSTNDAARELAHAGGADGLLVLADLQTAGRGRLDRTWWAPPGSSLLMSLLLRAPAPLRYAGQLSMCLGLGTVGAIEEAAGLRAGLKWPNDVVFEGRKLGGMLSEIEADGARVAWVVVGMGLNVNVQFEAVGSEVPTDIRRTATSLRDIAGRPFDRLALLARILSGTEQWYDRVVRGELIHEAWRDRLDTIGERVRVNRPAGALEGIATGVTAEGGLVLRDDAGDEHCVWTGDVTSLRPASGVS